MCLDVRANNNIENYYTNSQGSSSRQTLSSIARIIFHETGLAGMYFVVGNFDLSPIIRKLMAYGKPNLTASINRSMIPKSH